MNQKILSILKSQIFRWGLNTVISFVVNLGVTIGLHEGIGTRPELAYGVALITVFLMNFIFFRYYVFVQEHPSPIGQQFLIYAGSAIGFRLMEYASFFIIHSLFGLYYVTTVILVQGVAFIVKFFFYGKVFHGRSANST